LSLQVHYQNKKFRLKHSKSIRNWLGEVIVDLGFSTGEIAFIFTDDNFLREINRSFLEHDYYTDVITFDLSEESGKIDGEIYISTETVKQNAILYKILFYDEIKRVMVHGVLHLAGYDDVNKKDKIQMRKMEDYYLEKYSEE